MRRAGSHLPEILDFQCMVCGTENVNAEVTDIDTDKVRVECANCGEPNWEDANV